MKQISLFFKNLKPLSTNKAVRHGRHGSYSSNDKKLFYQLMSGQLLPYKKPLEIFDKNFDPFKNEIYAEIEIKIPESELRTKNGKLRLRSNDLDNFLKYILDNIFKAMRNCDDSFITELRATKKASSDGKWHFAVHLEY